MHCIITRGLFWHRYGLVIATAFSAVLLIPLVHSYSYQGVFGYAWKISGSATHGERNIAIANMGGIISFNFDDSPGRPLTVGKIVKRRGPFFWWTRPTDFHWYDFPKNLWMIGPERRLFPAVGVTETSIYIPAWMLIAVCGIAPSLWLRRHLRRRAKRDQRGFAVETSNGT